MGTRSINRLMLAHVTLLTSRRQRNTPVAIRLCKGKMRFRNCLSSFQLQWSQHVNPASGTPTYDAWRIYN